MKGFLRRLRKRLSGRRSQCFSAVRGSGQKLGIEALESRAMLAVDPLLLPTISFTVSIGDTTGDLVVETLPHLAPSTVENFANYIEDGDYLTGIFHRLDKTPGQQVIQAGLLTSPTQEFTDADQFDFVPTDAPIPNEPDGVLRPNVRGAIGMARTADPDSATSGFYFNTQDNPGFDEPPAPVGFTVFGNLTSESLAVLDMIAALELLPEAPLGLTTVPFADANGGTRNLVRFEEISATGTIHGVKFNDRNGDGMQDPGEEGLAGVTIFVDINGNGVLDGPDQSTQTNDEGRYAFALDLEDGQAQTFIVREADDPGMVQTAPDTGFHVVLVRPGLDSDNIDFGNQLLPVVEIVASDPAASEPGTDQGEFRLFVANASAATITGDFQVMFAIGGTASNDVDYALDPTVVTLGPGNLSTTVEVAPIDDNFTEGSETAILTLLAVTDVYVTGNPGTATVAIADNEVSASLAGQVYLDANGNGIRDEGDLAIGGVATNASGPDDLDETIETASDGSYQFEDLDAGEFTITEDPENELQLFLQNGTATVGSQGGTADSEADQINIPNLAADAEGTGNDFNELVRKPEFWSKRDFLASTPTENILAAVDAETNETEWFAVSDAWQQFTSVDLSLSADLEQVTLTVTDSEEDTQSITLDATDPRQVRFLGNVENTFLIGIVGEPADFMFEEVEVESTSQPQPNASAADDTGNGRELGFPLPVAETLVDEEGAQTLFAEIDEFESEEDG